MSLLSVDHLNVSLGGRQVLKDISFSLAAGELVGLIGPNGAGKSSLMRALMNIIPASGLIALGGEPADMLSAVQRARLAAYIAQGRDVAWAMPVEDVVALGRTPHLTGFGRLADVDRDAVQRAMQQLGVTTFAGRPATELSGGELARVLISRALAQETPLLLADEPAAGLDPAHQLSLMRLFSDLGEQGRGILVSTHDLGLAARFCTRLILMDAGKLVADGLPETVLTPKNLGAVYGVKAFFGTTEGGLIVQPIDIARPSGKEHTT